jgi:hypothetical protein
MSKQKRKLTPAVKGQLTKAVKASKNDQEIYGRSFLYGNVRQVFERIMPREQAKHAARQYLAEA